MLCIVDGGGGSLHKACREKQKHPGVNLDSTYRPEIQPEVGL